MSQPHTLRTSCAYFHIIFVMTNVLPFLGSLPWKMERVESTTPEIVGLFVHISGVARYFSTGHLRKWFWETSSKPSAETLPVDLSYCAWHGSRKCRFGSCFLASGEASSRFGPTCCAGRAQSASRRRRWIESVKKAWAKLRGDSASKLKTGTRIGLGHIHRERSNMIGCLV